MGNAGEEAEVGVVQALVVRAVHIGVEEHAHVLRRPRGVESERGRGVAGSGEGWGVEGEPSGGPERW